MKNKKVKLLTILLFVLASYTEIYAQTALYIKDNLGIQTPFAFNSIRKLTFPDGRIMITSTNGNTATYALSNISNINLSSLTANVSPISSKENTKFLLYPNPVLDQLNISYETVNPGTMIVEIIDLQGKVLYHQIINYDFGLNHSIIPVLSLSRGLYICRLQSDKKIEIRKFFKN